MTKNSYAQFNDVRAYQDKKTGDIHLTIKDVRLQDGFKLTLNAGRKEELALRAILEAEDKSTPLPASLLPEHASYAYHIPSLKSAPQEGEFEGYSYKEVSTALKNITSGSNIPLGAKGMRRFDNAFWKVTQEKNMLVAGGKKSGLITFLRSIVEFTTVHSDKWKCTVIDSGKNKIHHDENQSIHDIDAALTALRELMDDAHSRSRQATGGAGHGYVDKRTMVIIYNIGQLRPSNPNSWAEVLKYEELLQELSVVETAMNCLGIHVIQASDSLTSDDMEAVNPHRYAQRVLIGRTPLEISEFILGPNNDAGTRIPKMPGRALTIKHFLEHYNRDTDPAMKETLQEIQTFDLTRD